MPPNDTLATPPAPGPGETDLSRLTVRELLMRYGFANNEYAAHGYCNPPCRNRIRGENGMESVAAELERRALPPPPPADDAPREGDEFADLEAVARAATPGPWYSHNVDDAAFMNVYLVSDSKTEPEMGDMSGLVEHGKVIALTLYQAPRVVCHADERWSENADYIAAANPARVLALLARVRRQAARVGELTRERDKAVRVFDHLRDRARELCPDYPFKPESDAFDHLWALSSSLEGTRQAVDQYWAPHAAGLQADRDAASADVERLTAGRVPEDAEPVTRAFSKWLRVTDEHKRDDSEPVALAIAGRWGLILLQDNTGLTLGHLRRFAALSLTPTL